MSNEEVLTHEIVLDSGHKVEIRQSINARAYLKLKNYIVSKTKMKNEVSGYDKNGSPKTSMSPSINGEDIVGLEELTVQTYVLSFNGDKNNAFNRMMDTISGIDYEVIKEKIDSINNAESKK